MIREVSTFEVEQLRLRISELRASADAEDQIVAILMDAEIGFSSLFERDCREKARAILRLVLGESAGGERESVR